MTISSRTPEGCPNNCPVCGHDLRLEPSLDTRDAPCPSCGTLLWFPKHAKSRYSRVTDDFIIRLAEPRLGKLPTELASRFAWATTLLRAGLKLPSDDELLRFVSESANWIGLITRLEQLGRPGPAELVLCEQRCCYMSTPERLRSFVGRFIYLYTETGRLQLTKNRLIFFRSQGIPIDIDLRWISEVSTGHYSRWAKLIRLDYVSVAFLDFESKKTLLLTPTHSARTPAWTTNKIVADWKQQITDAWAAVS